MKKEEIISEIQRIAKENENKAPGFEHFSALTGIRRSDWHPNIWLRWSEALTEAGYKPNSFNVAYDTNLLISKYIELIRELGHFPISGEIRRKENQDKNFPSHTTFSKLGTKYEQTQKIIEYCNNNPGFDDVIELCQDVLKSSNIKTSQNNVNPVNSGYVYLIKHGSRNEYKIGKTNNPIRREGEIRLELPEKVNPIHYIQTDDPSGVEQYWHLRFENKRKEGEWFSLSAEDVRAFKRWKKIF